MIYLSTRRKGLKCWAFVAIKCFVLLGFPSLEGAGTGLFAQQFKAGLLAGIASSQVDGDTYSGYNKAGMLAGGFVTKKFSPANNWSASFEITYIQKGSRKIPHPDKGDYADYKLKLNYLEVPVLVKYDFMSSHSFSTLSDSASGRRMKFSLLGGIALGSLVHSAEWDASGLLLRGTSFQKVDFSTVFGLSYWLSDHIGFDIRTEYSIMPVRKNGTSSYYPNWTSKFFKPGYYNNLIVFLLHYRF